MMSYIKPCVRCQAAKKSPRDRILLNYICVPKEHHRSKLVDALNMRPATVSEQTDKLIELGYVTKHIDYMDKRISVVTLTAEGKTVRQNSFTYI